MARGAFPAPRAGGMLSGVGRLDEADRLLDSCERLVVEEPDRRWLATPTIFRSHGPALGRTRHDAVAERARRHRPRRARRRIRVRPDRVADDRGRRVGPRRSLWRGGGGGAVPGCTPTTPCGHRLGHVCLGARRIVGARDGARAAFDALRVIYDDLEAHQAAPARGARRSRRPHSPGPGRRRQDARQRGRHPGRTSGRREPGCRIACRGGGARPRHPRGRRRPAGGRGRSVIRTHGHGRARPRTRRTVLVEHRATRGARRFLDRRSTSTSARVPSVTRHVSVPASATSASAVSTGGDGDARSRGGTASPTPSAASPRWWRKGSPTNRPARGCSSHVTRSTSTSAGSSASWGSRHGWSSRASSTGASPTHVIAGCKAGPRARRSRPRRFVEGVHMTAPDHTPTLLGISRPSPDFVRTSGPRGTRQRPCWRKRVMRLRRHRSNADPTSRSATSSCRSTRH